MYGLRNMLLEESTRLHRIEEKVKNQLKDAPEGSLRISKYSGHIQYFHCTEEDPRNGGKYLRKSEKELVHQLAQKRYDERRI